MGTINERKRKDGTSAYLAQIVIKRDGKIVHRDNRTFDRRQAASAWLEKRERELAKPGAIEQINAGDPTLEKVINRYIEESEKEIGKTKSQVLRAIKEFPLAKRRCSQIGSAEIVEFAQEKLATGVEPQTVGNYLSHLGSIFSIARPAWKYPLDPQAMSDAWIVLKKLGTVRKSRERDQRPTIEQLEALLTHFGERQTRRRTVVPMQKIVIFAIFSTRRQEEIIRIKWDDLDVPGKRVLVRDMKNPGEKVGNDVWCDLPQEALDVALSMPRLADEIFPYSTDAIGAAFTRACYLLGFSSSDAPAEKNLRFHDLRHDGVSRLFEMGLNIPHVAAVSGHRSWQSLKRYTHLRQVGDKYAGWSWVALAAQPIADLQITKKGEMPRRRRSQRGLAV
ncbi:tyrosine-type recombinase/integrase [Aminobacter aminovorans]|uniref:tyrosine-type recombinase/integrase n=1 Tax=Aminobacter aminovorans TaxID=83263 RepID=UPI0028676781|nr:tyrosine-type recombinase/integrase [Aminobacter aminovorans]MDR7220378.1 integrase [Aminobacter aminovorans]